MRDGRAAASGSCSTACQSRRKRCRGSMSRTNWNAGQRTELVTRTSSLPCPPREPMDAWLAGPPRVARSGQFHAAFFAEARISLFGGGFRLLTPACGAVFCCFESCYCVAFEPPWNKKKKILYIIHYFIHDLSILDRIRLICEYSYCIFVT